MKKLSNSLSAAVFKCTAALATIMFLAMICCFCSCSSTSPMSQDDYLELTKQVELYKSYYEASENFIKMTEKAEWTFHNHDWSDTYWASEEGQDLIEAKTDLEDMLKHIPEDTTCVYMPSYDDLIKERNLLWNLLQVTAVQDTIAWETKVKKLPEWKEYDKFLLHDWEDMEYWKYRPIDLKYEELSEE